MDGEVLIVDEFTGRILQGRRYNEGMHQAIEAKEGVEIKQENQTLATITLQNYFRLYDKLGGHDRYGGHRGRRVRPGLQARRRTDPDQPRHDPHRSARTSSTRPRTRSGPRSSRTSSSATRRVSRSWSARRASRRASTCPVCCCAAASRTRCSTRSSTRRKPRSSRRRAARAPSQSRRTWPAAAPTSCSAATPRSMATHRARRAAGCPRSRTPRTTKRRGRRRCRRRSTRSRRSTRRSSGIGGLYVLGTERHDSRRIDNQLRGRSGRQGDPGESRFYLSLGDDLMRHLQRAHGRGDHGPAEPP